MRLRPVPAALEAVDHFLPAGRAEAAVEELRLSPGSLGNPVDEEISHLNELRKDEDLAARRLHFVEDVEKPAHLARRHRIEVRGRGCELRGGVADLLQLQHHLQNEGAPHEGVVRQLDDLHVLSDDGAVERRLRLREAAEFVRRDLVRQVADDRLVGLHAAHDEGSRHALEAFGHLIAVVVFNRKRELVLKTRRRAEEPGIGRLHHGPVFHEAVFNRRARHGDKAVGIHASHGLEGIRAVVLEACASSITMTRSGILRSSSCDVRSVPYVVRITCPVQRERSLPVP